MKGCRLHPAARDGRALAAVFGAGSRRRQRGPRPPPSCRDLRTENRSNAGDRHQLLSRKSYEAAAVSLFDNPISGRFDENDALVYFDEVKVPWERVFVYRDTDMCRAQFHDTLGHTFQNYQAQIRLSVKIRFLAGIARRLAETTGIAVMPAIREEL